MDSDLILYDDTAEMTATTLQVDVHDAFISGDVRFDGPVSFARDPVVTLNGAPAPIAATVAELSARVSDLEHTLESVLKLLRKLGPIPHLTQRTPGTDSR